MQQLPRRILPPGIEDDVVFGIMWIRVGTLKTIKTAPSARKVFIQFWGQEKPAELLSSQLNLQTQQYEVKCPVTIFQKYVQDMKKNLKIQVQGLGIVILDLTAYLKSKITITTKAPFDHFKGFFDILGKNSKKTGSIELQFCANFSPQVALRELGQQNAEVEEPICPAEGILQCGCKGNCKCQKSKITALDVIAVQKPELFKEFYEEYKQKVVSPKQPKQQISPFVVSADPRIAHSLNNEPNKAPFEPSKYEEPATPVRQNFPAVQKVLTYSNLRLDIDPESNKQTESQPQPAPIKPLTHQISIKIEEELKRQKPRQIQQQKVKINTPQKVREPPRKLSKIQQKQIQLKAESEQKNQAKTPLAKLKSDINASISEVSEVRKINQEVSLDAHREILSRVINLNEELQKQKHSPVKQVPVQQKPRPLQQLPKAPNFFQPPPFYRTAPTFKKKNNLILNMIFDINSSSVKLNKQCRYTIRFRPYGEKEIIKIGPHFQPTITLMFPVGEPQIFKMNKVPFIIEFWSAVDNEFLGVIKISLQKIFKGFILDGRLNEMAIKTSILPTVIHKGTISITSLVDKPVGECHLQAHIGTTSQLQSYLSIPKEVHQTQPDPIPIPSPSKPVQQEIVKTQFRRQKGSLQDLTQLLTAIDHHEKSSLAELHFFASHQKATRKEFTHLLDKLNFKGGDPFYLLAEKDELLCQQLSLCFDDYQTLKEHYQQLSQKEVSSISQTDLNSLVAMIKKLSKLGVVDKEDLNQIELFRSKLELSLNYMPDLITQEKLINWLQSRGKIPLEPHLKSDNILISLIQERFLTTNRDSLLVIEKLLEQIQAEGKADLSLKRVRQSLKNQRNIFSKWFWLHLCKRIYSSNGQQYTIGSENINPVLLYNWMAALHQHQQQIPLQQVQKEENQQESKTITDKNESVRPDEISLKQNEKKNDDKIDQQTFRPIKEPPIQISQPKKQVHQVSSPSKSSRPSTFLHSFTIHLDELQLQKTEQGDCFITYQFPLEDQTITSKVIRLQPHQHKYQVTARSQHQLLLADDLSQHFGQAPLHIICELPNYKLIGDLHPDQLVNEGMAVKVVPLFQANQDGIAGKIKLRIQYSRKQSSEERLGRQTTQDVFLPKNGFLNYTLQAQVDESKLRQQFNIKNEFYLQLVLDLFGDNHILAPHHPPIMSKLQTDLKSPLSVSGSYKLTLHPHILEHFRSGQWVAKLVAVYYSKEQGNYQKKEVVVGSLKAPLLSAIRQGGLKGDYAFKNSLGMFTCLAHAAISYDKKSTNKTTLHDGNTQHSRQSYWLILDFCELLNFQGDLGWVKFQTIKGGKRYSTDKCFVRQSGVFFLDHHCLAFQMGQQEFTSLKILPIKVVTQRNPLALDINLRPIAKHLHTHKLFVNSHYFLTVDQQARPSKLRVGCKVYAMRGTLPLSHFVEALTNNPIRIQTPAIPKDQDYYPMLEALKKELKISARTLEEALNLLLDKRKKQKLPQIFFNSTIWPSLDLTPLIGSSQDDLDTLGQQLPSQIDFEALEEHIQRADIVLVNWRSQFVKRYNFSRLNEHKLDQNVQYLGLHQQIDLPVLLRKIKIEEVAPQIQEQEQIMPVKRQLTITLLRGYDFHMLYNGIKPNALLRLPQLELETQPAERTSEPIFNEQLTIPFSGISHLTVQAYHASGQPNQDVLIGQAVISLLDFMKAETIPFRKTLRVVLQSVMSNRMQAAIDIKLELLGQQDVDRSGPVERSRLDESSVDDQMIENAIRRIKESDIPRNKAHLFESDQEDDM